MRSSKRVLASAKLLPIAATLIFLGQSVGTAQPVDRATRELAASIFSDLGVRPVRCPTYTFEGGNQPVCGVSEMTPEAYTAAFDRATQGRLEPAGPWDEDHTVWLRRFTSDEADYAAVYSEIARGFNVQLIRLP